MPVCITVPCVVSTHDATSSAKLQAHASDSFHWIFIDVSDDSDVPVITVDAISASVSSVASGVVSWIMIWRSSVSFIAVVLYVRVSVFQEITPSLLALLN